MHDYTRKMLRNKIILLKFKLIYKTSIIFLLGFNEINIFNNKKNILLIIL